MEGALDKQIFELVDWLAKRERTYSEVMQACRSWCDKASIWEEANRRGLVRIERVNESRIVKATSLGLILAELRRETPRKRQREQNGVTLSSPCDLLAMYAGRSWY